VVFADGSVRKVGPLPPSVLRALITRNGGEVVPSEANLEFARPTTGRAEPGGTAGQVADGDGEPLHPPGATPGVGGGPPGMHSNTSAGGPMRAPGGMKRGTASGGPPAMMSGGPGRGGMQLGGGSMKPGGGAKPVAGTGRASDAAGYGAMGLNKDLIKLMADRDAAAQEINSLEIQLAKETNPHKRAEIRIKQDEATVKQESATAQIDIINEQLKLMPAMMGGAGATTDQRLATPPMADSERRLAALEAKMERLLKEIESLRKERRGSGGNGAGGGDPQK
jgi:hypothetical protein